MMVSVLVDTNIFGWAFSREGKWQSNGEMLWGGQVPVDTGFVKPTMISKKSKHEVDLFTIACEAKRGLLDFHTTDALSFEKIDTPKMRRSSNLGDVNLLEGIGVAKHETLPDFCWSVAEGKLSVALRAHLSELRHTDRLFCKIADMFEAIGTKFEKISQDAWHLRCFQELRLDYFLTNDEKLLRQIKSFPQSDLRQELESKCVTPVTLVQRLGLVRKAESDLDEFLREKCDWPC